jgi:predicted benzoate:H+ symporter BenE
MDRKRFAIILSWVALLRFLPGFAIIAYAVKGLIDALVYGRAEFCTGPKYHTICNTVTTAQYPQFHWQVQMDWLYLAFGLSLLLAGWFVLRK